jgi:hypothetical protein
VKAIVEVYGVVVEVYGVVAEGYGRAVVQACGGGVIMVI